MKIYIVKGSNWGEWERGWQWNVKAFLSKEIAEIFCGELNQWLKDNNPKGQRRIWPKNNLDPKFISELYNNEYEIEEIEFDDLPF